MGKGEGDWNQGNRIKLVKTWGGRGSRAEGRSTSGEEESRLGRYFGPLTKRHAGQRRGRDRRTPDWMPKLEWGKEERRERGRNGGWEVGCR